MSIPTVTIRDPVSEIEETLLALQSAVLKHPVATQAILSALTAEGRRYSQTEDGHAKLVALSESDLLQKLWRVWEGTTLWSFNPDESSILPSAYIDALFMSANSKDLETVIERLASVEEPPNG